MLFATPIWKDVFQILTQILKLSNRGLNLLFIDKFHDSFSLVYNFAIFVEFILEVFNVLVELSTLLGCVFESGDAEISSDILENVHVVVE